MAIVTVDRTQQIATSKLEVGITPMTEFLDPTGTSPTAIQRAKDLLRGNVAILVQSMIGGGPPGIFLDPTKRDPATWNWGVLDRRINQALEMGLKPWITLWCAPTWQVLPPGDPALTIGEMNWTKNETEPLDQYMADFAYLCQQVAIRYPAVKHFQFWNEMKGYWNTALTPDNWDYVRYTRQYNLAWDAINQVRPDASLGGPYLVIEATGSRELLIPGMPLGFWNDEPISDRNLTVLKYFMANRRYKPGDMLVIDRSVATDHDDWSYTPEQVMKLSHWYGDIVTQIKGLPDYKGEPIGFAEFYSSQTDVFKRASIGSAFRHILLAGASFVHLWSPQRQKSGSGGHALFTNVYTSDGGQALPIHETVKLYHNHFPPGTLIYKADSDTPTLEALASSRGTLLINKAPTTVPVTMGSQALNLEGYGVKFVEAPVPDPDPDPDPDPEPGDLEQRLAALELRVGRLEVGDADLLTRLIALEGLDEEQWRQLNAITDAINAFIAAWRGI